MNLLFRAPSRSTARIGLLLIIGGLLWGISPEWVVAQTVQDYPSTNITDQFINFFGGLSQEINQQLIGWAKAIFLVSAAIQIALILYDIILEEISRRSVSSGGIQGLLRKLLYFSLFIGISGFLLDRNADITDYIEKTLHERVAPYTVDGLCYSGSPTGASTARPIKTGDIIQLGWYMFEETNENFIMAVAGSEFSDETGKQETDSWWGSEMASDLIDTIDSYVPDFEYYAQFFLQPVSILVLLATLLIIPTFFVIAFQVVIAEITLRMIAAFMPIALAFLPLTFLSPLISGYIRFYLYQLLKVFFIYLLLIPIIQIPQMLFTITGSASKVGDVNTSGGEPMGCLDSTSQFVGNPGKFGGFDKVDPPKTFYQRADLAFITIALLFAGASILKTIPDRIATFMTQQFSLQPLYELID